MDEVTHDTLLTCLNHASLRDIKELAREVSDYSNVRINTSLSKDELINTMIAVYIKMPEMLPEDGILTPDGINYFSFEAHCVCPFSETSIYRRMFLRLYDKFKKSKFSKEDVYETASTIYDTFSEDEKNEVGTKKQAYTKFFNRLRYNEKVVKKHGDLYKFTIRFDK